jgi:hypothetical protein
MLHKLSVQCLGSWAIALFGGFTAYSLFLSSANAQTFEPPSSNPAPTTTIGGGRRGSDGQCLKDRDLQTRDVKNKQSLDQQLTPLLPPTKFGLTISSTPELFAYIPKTNAIAVEFTLENAQGKGVARKRLELTNTPSIVKAQFEDTSLEVGKDYKWLISVICETGDPEDVFVEGIIRRINPTQPLLKKLQQASAIEKVYTYAELGIWYEAIAELANLRISQPDSKSLQTNWSNLLKSSSLEALINVPIKN